MRRTRSDIAAILPHLCAILFVFGIVLLLPLFFVLFGGDAAEVPPLVFLGPAALTVIAGMTLRAFWRGLDQALSVRHAMLPCTVSWLAVSAVGALTVLGSVTDIDALEDAGVYRPNTDEFEVPRGGPRIQANGDVFLVSAAHDLSKAARLIVRKK